MTTLAARLGSLAMQQSNEQLQEEDEVVDVGFLPLSSDQDSQAFADALIRSGRKISHLKAAWCKISPQGAQALAGALTNCGSVLKSLVLRDNAFKDVGMQALGNAISKHCLQLELLDLGTNSLTDTSCDAIACILDKCTALESVNIKNNLITDEGLEKIRIFLSQHSLSEFMDGGNKVTAFGQAKTKFAVAIGCIRRGDHHVDASLENQLPQDQHEAMNQLYSELSSAFFQHSNSWRKIGVSGVTSLDVGGSGLTDVGLGSLAPALTYCDTLRTLNCEASAFTDVGVELLTSYTFHSLTLDEIDADGWCLGRLNDALNVSLYQREGRQQLLAWLMVGAHPQEKSKENQNLYRTKRKSVIDFFRGNGDGAVMRIVASFLLVGSAG